jgi:hypothetical protein
MTLTLTEFLLARIAEDERAAQDAVVERDTIFPNGAYGTPELAMWAEVDTGVPCVGIEPDRALAECEAKRRIVEAADRAQRSLERRARPATDAISGHVIAFREVVGYLALPYADHPDFRQEWKL